MSFNTDMSSSSTYSVTGTFGSGISPVEHDADGGGSTYGLMVELAAEDRKTYTYLDTMQDGEVVHENESVMVRPSGTYWWASLRRTRRTGRSTAIIGPDCRL